MERDIMVISVTGTRLVFLVLKALSTEKKCEEEQGILSLYILGIFTEICISEFFLTTYWPLHF